MPCRSDYLEHTAREAESGRVLEFLKEIAGQPFDHDKPSYYGKIDTLDADTARLCDWCRGNEDHMSACSLELQLWWQRHKKADAKREAEDRARAEVERLANEAKAKLTQAELDALGVKR